VTGRRVRGRRADAAGALLLFLANFAAIVVVACVVFVLSGAAPSREVLRERNHLRTGFVLAVVALVLIATPLAWTAADRIQASIRTTTGAPFVRAWIGDRDLAVTGWTVEGDRVQARLSGTEAPAEAAPLAADLAKAFGAPVSVEIVFTPVVRDIATGTP
jgi:hypothetical protein